MQEAEASGYTNYHEITTKESLDQVSIVTMTMMMTMTMIISGADCVRRGHPARAGEPQPPETAAEDSVGGDGGPGAQPQRGLGGDGHLAQAVHHQHHEQHQEEDHE